MNVQRLKEWTEPCDPSLNLLRCSDSQTVAAMSENGVSSGWFGCIDQFFFPISILNISRCTAIPGLMLLRSISWFPSSRSQPWFSVPRWCWSHLDVLGWPTVIPEPSSCSTFGVWTWVLWLHPVKHVPGSESEGRRPGPPVHGELIYSWCFHAFHGWLRI